MSKSLTIPLLVLAVGFSSGAFAQEQYAPPPPQAQAPGADYAAPQQDYPPPAQAYPQAQGYSQPQAYPQAQGYPPPPSGYAPPDTAYDEPVAPPGAVWVGAPGECLYGNGSVYWCAPGVVFSGFPAGWDYGRYPVGFFGAGIVVDPIWFNGWRGGHPGFAFRGRFATDGERRAFFDHRAVFIHDGGRRPGPGYGRPEDRRDDHRDDRH